MSVNNKNFDASCNSPEDVISMLDDMMGNGASRVKVLMSEDIELGTVKKQYHHGRCDINSPFACGTVFDLLEDDNS